MTPGEASRDPQLWQHALPVLPWGSNVRWHEVGSEPPDHTAAKRGPGVLETLLLGKTQGQRG